MRNREEIAIFQSYLLTRVPSQMATATSSAPAPHLPALDGIRALSVFIVILSHSVIGQGAPGDLGVTAFFVLSGFLITWLLIREFTRDGSISFKGFYMRRTLRIMPAFYGFMLFSVAVDLYLGVRWSSGLLLSGLTYTINYYNAFQGHPTTSLAHAWSLAVEEQFYLIWPIAFLALWRRGLRTALITLGVVIGIVVLWRSYLYLGVGVPASYVYNAFDTRADALALGCLVGLSFQTQIFRNIQAYLSRSAALPLLTLAALYVSRQRIGSDYHYSIGFTVDAMLLAVFIVQLLALSSHPAWKWLNAKPVRYLGLISYPCYLYHAWGMAVGERVVGAGPEWAVFIAGYVATILFATGSYYIIEKPFLALKSRWSPSAVSQPVKDAVITGEAVEGRS